MLDKESNGRGLVKYSLISFTIGVFPLFYILTLYLINPDSPILFYLFTMSDGHARAFSEEFLIYSTISSTYTKSGPLFSVGMYLLCWKKVKFVVFGIPIKKVIKILPSMIFIIVFGYYLMYSGELNLTTKGGWWLGFISGNILFLFIFFMMSFISHYGIAWIAILYLYILVKTIHNKTH
ncbi:hypothetical protein F9C28_17210 [Shimwellia pseudoproteus]|uniref:hypothetical protein n=1 Tax=Shimwellia pseudoproteus TaxID=570012 RepID=UPI0018EB25D5|nr:hypothetical protein [Shimwellia pseudoproteus]MBJ3816606.1 hypothetical protein [Shimwellia pseudoproteus]